MEKGIDVVVGYLRGRNPDAGSIGLDTELIESRILDSLAFVEFLTLLEEVSGREIDPETVTRADFRTVRSIVRRFFPDVAERG